MFCDSPRKKIHQHHASHSKFELIGKASAPPPANASVAMLKQSLRSLIYNYNNSLTLRFDLDTDLPEVRSGKLVLHNMTRKMDTDWMYAIIGSDRIVIINTTNYNEYMDLRISTTNNIAGYFVAGDEPELMIFTVHSILTDI